jgi:hypothetical protein
MTNIRRVSPRLRVFLAVLGVLAWAVAGPAEPAFAATGDGGGTHEKVGILDPECVSVPPPPFPVVGLYEAHQYNGAYVFTSANPVTV